MKQLPWIATNAHQRMNGNAWTMDWLKVPWCRQIVVMFTMRVIASNQSAVSEVFISCFIIYCRQVYMNDPSSQVMSLFFNYFSKQSEIFPNFNHLLIFNSNLYEIYKIKVH